MSEGKDVVKYQAKDGQEITLSFQVVRDYLVHGDKEKVKPQELMFFMGVCKSRGLNPFKKDCYLIKYGDDPAAIVTSIDFYRSRARAQKDCKGWKAGVVIKSKEALEYREGSLLIDGETLVGGWFEAKPDGWPEPKKHSVTLKGYIKRTREGKITRFWSEENQPSQIMKVAEAQGLRMVWPDEFEKLYSEEEILAEKPDTAEALKAAADKAREEAITKFKDSMPAPYIFEHPKLQEFLGKLAQANRCSIDDVMVEAADKADEFWQGYEEWLKENQEKSQTPEAGPPSQQAEPAETHQAPNGGPPPFPNHAQADAEIERQEREKNSRKGSKKQMVKCPPGRKFAGKDIATIFCQTTCPDKECQFAKSAKGEREPGEEG